MPVENDKVAIREVIEAWVVTRDAGLWKPLLDLWHSDGQMRTTWFSGGAEAFVSAVQRVFEDGVIVHHFLGGTMIDLVGDRAIAQSKVVIANRVPVDGVECDLSCHGRFYDFFERREGRWRIALRQAIYEKDRLDPVDPSAVPVIDHAILASFPVGCRHLLYAQQQAGLPIIADQAGLRGARVEALYASGAEWLAGAPVPQN